MYLKIYILGKTLLLINVVYQVYIFLDFLFMVISCFEVV